MIRNQWYAVLDAKEIKPGKLTGVKRMGEQLVFWRAADGKIVCMRDLCPHRGVALSTGILLGDHLQCPFHGFEFDASGQCTLIPANGRNGPVPKAMRVGTYPTLQKHGFIWIWWGQPQDDLPEIPFFASIDDSLSYSTIKDHWKTHYSRAIENQLDVVHIPFIHRTTIGRGNKTIVDGPVSECCIEEDGVLNIWVSNRVDDGTPARSAKEIPTPQRTPSLQFHYPNIWHNWISDKVRVLVFFAPIDDENTLMYLRFYQKFMGAPVIKSLVNGMGALANLYVERQDRWVVETQRPKRSGLRIGERLVPGDQPIILYRRRREELIEAASKTR